jgi:surfactin synthase thioesterase subunit
MEWQCETEYMLDLQILPGDHFFIFKHPNCLIQQMMEAYTMARAMTFRKLSLGIDI